MVTISAQAVKFILQVASTMILARLLLPADYGLVAMVTAVTGFVAMFKDAGLSMATVQRDRINHAQVSTLFWINVGVSLVLLAVTAALAPLLAAFYGEPRLTSITLVVAAMFIFSGLTAQHQALLKRQMRFTALAGIEITALVAGNAAAIVGAWIFRLGYWALVLSPSVTVAVNCMMVWIMSGWRPGRPQRGAGVWPMLTFGGHLTGFNFLNYFVRNSDNVILGWLWGAGPLGLYAKAYQLLMLPISQINAPVSSVALPALSRLQSTPEQYRRYYYTTIGALVSLGAPVVVFSMVMARDVILVMLGKQWLGSVLIFQLLGPAALVGTANVSAGWACISLGHTARMMHWAIISVPMIVLLYMIGAPYGPQGMAVTCSLGICASWIAGNIYCLRGTHVNALMLLGMMARGVATAAVAAAPLAPILTWTSGPPLARLIAGLLIYGASYFLAATFLLPERIKPLRLMKDLSVKFPAAPALRFTSIFRPKGGNA
jgi:PST family polysaccharide transporter